MAILRSKTNSDNRMNTLETLKIRTTRTGQFPIGFRRIKTWPLRFDELTQWALKRNIAVVDLMKDGSEAVKILVQAGVKVGTVDLLEIKGMISSDTEKRHRAVSQNIEYIQAC